MEAAKGRGVGLGSWREHIQGCLCLRGGSARGLVPWAVGGRLLGARRAEAPEFTPAGQGKGRGCGLLFWTHPFITSDPLSPPDHENLADSCFDAGHVLGLQHIVVRQ